MLKFKVCCDRLKRLYYVSEYKGTEFIARNGKTRPIDLHYLDAFSSFDSAMAYIRGFAGNVKGHLRQRVEIEFMVAEGEVSDANV